LVTKKQKTESTHQSSQCVVVFLERWYHQIVQQHSKQKSKQQKKKKKAPKALQELYWKKIKILQKNKK
jgi:shikimate kinase